MSPHLPPRLADLYTTGIDGGAYATWLSRLFARVTVSYTTDAAGATVARPPTAPSAARVLKKGGRGARLASRARRSGLGGACVRLMRSPYVPLSRVCHRWVGSSLAAIKKYLAANHPAASNAAALRNALKAGVKKGTLVAVKASYKLSDDTKKAMQKAAKKAAKAEAKAAK